MQASTSLPYLETNPTTIILNEKTIQIDPAILECLLKVSNVFKRLNEQNQPFEFKDLSIQSFQCVVNILSRRRYDMDTEKVLRSLDGFSILECKGLSEELQIKFARRIHSYDLQDWNFIQCVQLYKWAQNRHLTIVMDGCREFIQRYIETHFEEQGIDQIAKAIDSINEQKWLPIALNLKKHSLSPYFFERLKLFSKSLVSLNVASPSLAKEDLDQLRCLVQLRSLILDCRQVSDLSFIRSLSALHTLSLLGSEICDDDLIALLDLPLVILKLERCQRINGIGLKHINRKLASLTLSGSKPFYKSLTPEGYETIGAFNKLKELNLRCTSITCEDLSYFYTLTCLTRLDLTDSVRLDDCVFEKFQHFPKLIELILNDCLAIKGWGLRDLPQHLQRLSLSGNYLEGEHLKYLQSLPDLSHLNLSRCTSINPLAWGHLAGINGLTEIDLSESSITNEGVMNLIQLSRLLYLNLENCHKVSSHTSNQIQEYIQENQNLLRRRRSMQCSNEQTDGIISSFFDVPSDLNPPKDPKVKQVKARFREKNAELQKQIAENQERSAKQIGELKEVVSLQRSENESLKKENGGLKEKVSGRERTIEELDRRLSSFQDRFDKMEELFDQRVSTLIDQNKGLEKQCEANNLEVKKLQERVIEQDAALEQANRVNREATKQLEELRKAVELLTEKIEKQDTLLVQEKAKTGHLEQQLVHERASSKAKLAEQDQLLAEKQAALDAEKAKVEQLVKHLSTLQANFDAEKEKHNLELAEQIALVKEKTAALEVTNKQLETTKKELEATKKALGATIEELEATQKALGATIEELKATKIELQTTKETLETTKKELETTKKELETTKKELETTKKELETTKKGLETTKKELETTKKELETTKKGLETAKKDLTTANTNLTNTKKDLTTAQNNHKATSKQLHNVRVSLKPPRQDCLDVTANIFTFGLIGHVEKAKRVKRAVKLLN